MKKKMTFLLFISLLFGFSIVKADTTDVNTTLNNYYQFFDYYITTLQTDNNSIDQLFSYYNSNLSEDYPYYVLYMTNYGYPNNPGYILQTYDSPLNTVQPTWVSSGSPPYNVALDYIINGTLNFKHIQLINGTIDVQSYTCSPGSCARPIDIYDTPYLSPIVESNFDISLTFNNGSYDFDSINFPAYISTVNSDIVFQNFSVSEGGIIPSYKSLYEGSYTPSVSYTTINLNNYSYIALSLKNYNVEPFSTIIMVEGQLCSTPVYDYGMKEKTEYYSGYQVDRCSPIYSSSTPNRFYILSQDLTNHAIFYIKAYDTTINNIIKVDSNVFDISYITSSNENNPSVLINGRIYPTIPYNELSSSSTESEEEGYISGESKNIFDISSDSNFIESVFSNPLQALKTTWASILLMFSLVGDFIGLLPTTLQAFLFTAFALALSIGLIKLIIS